jgi:preprotein translocase subunit SecG
MLIIFITITLIVAFVLGAIVLIQNPKGGGLSGAFGGFSNQLMGVKQTTDVLEKGTWIFAGVLGFLCLISVAFIPKNGGVSSQDEKYFNSKAPTTNTRTTAPLSNGTNPTTNH